MGNIYAFDDNKNKINVGDTDNGVSNIDWSSRDIDYALDTRFLVASTTFYSSSSSDYIVNANSVKKFTIDLSRNNVIDNRMLVLGILGINLIASSGIPNPYNTFSIMGFERIDNKHIAVYIKNNSSYNEGIPELEITVGVRAFMYDLY